MAEAYGKQGSRKTEELGELDQFMEHHLDEEPDEVRLRFRGSTDNLSLSLRSRASNCVARGNQFWREDSG